MSLSATWQKLLQTAIDDQIPTIGANSGGPFTSQVDGATGITVGYTQIGALNIVYVKPANGNTIPSGNIFGPIGTVPSNLVGSQSYIQILSGIPLKPPSQVLVPVIIDVYRNPNYTAFQGSAVLDTSGIVWLYTAVLDTSSVTTFQANDQISCTPFTFTWVN